MNKKIAISIIIFFLGIFIGIGIWILNSNNYFVSENNNSNNIENDMNNIVNISNQDITDDCLNEWSDYTKTINENTQSASNSLVNENTRYLVKDVNGYINIYCLDNLNNEILYKETDISTEYLSVEDLDDLEIGIEVKGSKKLNQLLEDFE